MGLVGLLVELLLPLILSGALLLLLAGYTRWWDLHTPLGLAAFAVLLVALSLFLSVRLDALTLERRRRSGKRRWLNRAEPRWRLAKFVCAGGLLPIAGLIVASRLELADHQTALARASLAVRSRLADPAAGRAARLGDAVLRAQSPSAKAQGILALQTLGGTEALDQLLRILNADETALVNESEYRALSTALASYGAAASARLVQRFDGLPLAARRSAAPPLGDAFEDELDGRGAGSAETSDATASVPSAPAGRNSDASRADARAAGTDRLPSFLMQTFLHMASEEDTDLLAFARKTAADESCSETVRGQALQLTAKLGGKDDLSGLFAYLDHPSARLQAYALKAIAALQAKLSAAAAKA